MDEELSKLFEEEDKFEYLCPYCYKGYYTQQEKHNCLTRHGFITIGTEPYKEF